MLHLVPNQRPSKNHFHEENFSMRWSPKLNHFINGIAYRIITSVIFFFLTVVLSLQVRLTRGNPAQQPQHTLSIKAKVYTPEGCSLKKLHLMGLNPSTHAFSHLKKNKNYNKKKGATWCHHICIKQLRHQPCHSRGENHGPHHPSLSGSGVNRIRLM